MFIVFEDRPSDSAFVERIFRCRSERQGVFLSMAASRWSMVVTKAQGHLTFTLRGPETHATRAECPPEGEWFGILFTPGTFMPGFLPGTLMDRKDLTLPDAGRRRFWLEGSAWEYPNFENAETFVDRLVQAELIVHDPLVHDALLGHKEGVSLRSAQRHVLKATGLTQGSIRQIERARFAVNLLKEGIPVLEAVHAAGYFDQAHLTRSLKRLIGQTPAQVRGENQQLSFLYKTGFFREDRMLPLSDAVEEVSSDDLTAGKTPIPFQSEAVSRQNLYR